MTRELTIDAPTIRIEYSVHGAAQISHHDGQRATTLDPHRVSVTAAGWGGPWARVEGQRIRQSDGTPSQQTGTISLNSDRSTDTYGMPVAEQPHWLRDLVRDGIKALEAAEQILVLQP